METIGERLKEWRKQNGLTMKAIEAQTGLSTGGLSAYERNEKLIGSKTLLALYSEYKIDITYILTGKKSGELTPEEQRLVDNWKQTNDQGRELMLGMSQSLALTHPRQEQESSTSRIG